MSQIMFNKLSIKFFLLLFLFCRLNIENLYSEEVDLDLQKCLQILKNKNDEDYYHFMVALERAEELLMQNTMDDENKNHLRNTLTSAHDRLKPIKKEYNALQLVRKTLFNASTASGFSQMVRNLANAQNNSNPLNLFTDITFTETQIGQIKVSIGFFVHNVLTYSQLPNESICFIIKHIVNPLEKIISQEENTHQLTTQQKKF